MIRGLSLRNAFAGHDQSACDLFLQEAACLVCGETGARETDWGLLKKHRQLLFYEVVKTCQCGFQNRWFVLGNDLERRRAPAIKTSREAMADALAHDDLDPVELDESVAQILALVFAKKSDAALVRAEESVAVLPDHPRAWYNLAWLYGEMGRLQEGIVAYQVCLSLQPESIEALYNQAFLMAEIGDAGRAVLNLARIISIAEAAGDTQLAEDMHKLVGETMTVKERLPAAVGAVEVVEDQIGRRLLINQQNQGGALFVPSAAQYLLGLPDGEQWIAAHQTEGRPLALEPGPVPDTFFGGVWTALALQHQDAVGLALGLGSGSGLVALLAEQPQLKMVVVELDPQVVATARAWFPLLRRFEEQGRLSLVTAEAGVWLDNHDLHRFAFLIADVFRGENEAPDILTPSRLEKAKAHEVDIWLNLIVDPKTPFFTTLGCRFEAAGLPWCYAAVSCPPNLVQRITANWILATRFPDLDALAEHRPFSWCAAEQLNLFTSYYRLLREWYLGADEIKTLLNSADMS